MQDGDRSSLLICVSPNYVGVETSLGNLGSAYGAKGNFSQAINYFQQALIMAQEIDDTAVQAFVRCNLAEALMKVGHYPEALANLQTTLDICEKTGDRFVKAQTYKLLADVYRQLNNHESALKYCNRAISIATELGIPLIQECQELKKQLINEL